MRFSVNGGKVTSVSISADNQSLPVYGTPVKLNAVAIGSINPEYRFFVRENGNTTTLQDFSTNNTISWTPTKSGRYTIIVHARDKSYHGAIGYEARAEISFEVNGGKVTSVNVSLSETPKIGSVISLTATSEGGLDPDYRFFVVKDGILTILQEYGNGNIANWVPTEAGIYKIIVHAKDTSYPNIGYYHEARLEFTIEL
jgi:uncharacterized protein YkuJ